MDLELKKSKWRRRTAWIAPRHGAIPENAWESRIPSGKAQGEREALIAEANRYVQGEYALLGISFRELRARANWHLDPQTGRQVPLVFGLDIDYRDTRVAGNVKNIWEKNRHHHLTVIALAYMFTNEIRYALELELQLRSWVEQNPFPLGINWSSSLELGIRLISWVWIERLLRGSPLHNALFGEKGFLWPAIYWHQWLISNQFSHGSSANNHLIGEMAGLFMASLIWPVFSESKQWQCRSKNILEREMIRQSFSSGINREQAFSYHIFSLEFFLLAGLEGARMRSPFSTTYKKLLRRMLEAIPPLTDAGGNLPRYGDSDEGMALQLRPLNSSRVDWLYRLGHSWLNAQVPCPNKDSGMLAAWVIWPDVDNNVDETPLPSGSVQFADAGHFVLANHRNTPQEVFCLVDAGPVGYLSIAAHGHADALSFTLSVGGTPIIVDPGTYIYHAEPEWRDYFRSTRAHNTVLINGSNQSVSGGPFMWLKKANTTMLEWKPTSQGGVLAAAHDGYTRLFDPVTHRRRLNLEEEHLQIEDRLKGTGVHSVEWRLHFSPECLAKLEAFCCYINWKAGSLKILLDDRMGWRLLRGDQDGGWYSPSFNVKEPTYTLVGSMTAELPITLQTSCKIEIS